MPKLPPLTPTLLTLLTLLFTILNIYIARTLSVSLLLRGYFFAFAFAMYSLAFVIMILGILVPPVMLVHWGYEVWTEVGPVRDGEGEDGEADGGEIPVVQRDAGEEER